MKLCIHIDIDKMLPKRLSNVIWDWPTRCRGSDSEKQWNWPYLLELFEYFDTIMHKHCYWRELDRGIAKCHLFFMKFCIIIAIDKI